VIYLLHYQLLPEKRLAELMADLFSVIGGQTQWLHIASTILPTFYHVSAKRGSLPENVTGIAVHDHWNPYFTLKGGLHALCNAHYLRELRALVEIEKFDLSELLLVVHVLILLHGRPASKGSTRHSPGSGSDEGQSHSSSRTIVTPRSAIPRNN
jgi:hypothetical protein